MPRPQQTEEPQVEEQEAPKEAPKEAKKDDAIHVHACTKCKYRGKTPELVDGKCPRCGGTVKVER